MPKAIYLILICSTALEFSLMTAANPVDVIWLSLIPIRDKCLNSTLLIAYGCTYNGLDLNDIGKVNCSCLC